MNAREREEYERLRRYGCGAQFALRGARAVETVRRLKGRFTWECDNEGSITDFESYEEHAKYCREHKRLLHAHDGAMPRRTHLWCEHTFEGCIVSIGNEKESTWGIQDADSATRAYVEAELAIEVVASHADTYARNPPITYAEIHA